LSTLVFSTLVLFASSDYDTAFNDAASCDTASRNTDINDTAANDTASCDTASNVCCYSITKAVLNVLKSVATASVRKLPRQRVFNIGLYGQYYTHIAIKLFS